MEFKFWAWTSTEVIITIYLIRKDNIQEILSLSPTQQGLLFKYQMDPKSSEYMEQVVLKIKGDITDKEIERVWHYLISALKKEWEIVLPY